jgi:hypothetical protein
MGDNNDEKAINMKRFILNILFLVTLLTNTLFDIVNIFILPFGMNLLILLTIVTFLWGIFAVNHPLLKFHHFV